MRLASNKNKSEIGNSATCRCDRRGATRGSWVRGPIVGLWVRRSWVVSSLFVGSSFVGSLFVGRGFAVRGLVGSWVRHSWVRGFAIVGSTISGWQSRRWCNDLNFLGSRSLSLCLRVSPFSLSFSLCPSPEIIWSENLGWKSFPLVLAYFTVKLKIFSVWPNLPSQPNMLFSEKWFPNFDFSQNKRTLKCIYF